MQPTTLKLGELKVNGVLYSESRQVEHTCNTRQDMELLMQYCRDRWADSRMMIKGDDTILVLIK